MKLGEALTLRRRQAEKLNDLRGRIRASAIVQEGDQAPENPADLILAYNALSEEHSLLVKSINRTNVLTTVSAGASLLDRSLLDLIQQKEDLIRKRNTLSVAIAAASPNRSDYRYMRSELRFVPVVNVPKLQADIDNYARQINELDLQIQALNWQTDLVE